MALTERKEQKLEILPNGVIQVQDINIIERDGIEISRLYSRKVVDVEDDTSGESGRLKAVAAVTWTPEVKTNRASEKNKGNA